MRLNHWLRVCAAFTLFVFSVSVSSAIAGSNLWTYKSNGKIKWHRQMAAGGILAGGDEALVCLDSETGAVQWKREDLQKTSLFEVNEIESTPYLLVEKSTGLASTAKLYALDQLTGTTLWESDKLRGVAIGVFPVVNKDMVVLFTSNGGTKDHPDMIAFQLSSGQLLWETKFEDKADLYKPDAKHSRFAVVRFDLSGHQMPISDDTAMYVPFAGLHKYDLATGKLLWKVSYDVTEGKLKRANAAPVIENGIIYTSAKGQLRAIETATGNIKWTSQDYGAGVAEMYVRNDRVYGRMGGTFYDWGKEDYLLKKPLGVVAINKNTGNMIWRYDKASESITNIAILDDQNTILIADKKNLIGLDMNSEGDKIKETFSVPIEFKKKMGGADVAMKAAKVYFGGVRGLMKSKEEKAAEDLPVAIIQQANGLAVIRGKQHILAFDNKAHASPWSIYFEAPGMSNFAKYAMIGLAYVNYSMATANARSTYLGTSENTRANNDRFKALQSFSDAVAKRYSATKGSNQFAYILTNVTDGDQKGSGIIAINLMSGETAGQVVLKEKEPEYFVDDLTGRLFNLKDDTITAFSIRQQ
jgi:outer membrane protein assembly factor BamB